MTGLRGALALTAAVWCLCASAAYAFEPGRYGSVKLAEPAGEARGVVIFFSDRKGLSTVDETAAQAIAKDGALVAELDSRKYLHHLDKLGEKCHWLVYDLELLTRQLEREHRFPNYLTPIIAGVGEGGTLAEMTLAQAPSATIAGAVSIDPAATIESRWPICPGLTSARRKGGYSYGAPIKLRGFWSVGLTQHVARADREYIERLRHDGASVDLREMPSGITTADALRSLLEPHLATSHPSLANVPKNIDLSALPLDELPVEHPSKLMVVFLSGDGGWRDLDKTVAEDLRQQGVPIVALDTLRYFWSKKTPAETTDVVAALIQTFMTKWHADQVALVGYSFGADVMPFVYNRLPPSLRDHVALITLMGLSKYADFEISVRGWLGEPPGADALPVLPEADKIPPRLIQCVYGLDETDTACPELARRGVETFRRNGGHHFDGNYGALADLIVAGFKQRAGLSPSQPAPVLESAANQPQHVEEHMATPQAGISVLTPMVVGAATTLFTILVHALALMTIVHFVRHEHRLGRAGVNFWKDVTIVAAAALLALAAHMAEIAGWAWVLLLCGPFPDFGAAFYHSALSYTTLGDSAAMPASWTLLGPLEAADGMLMFGVSTAMLFAVIQRLVQTRFAGDRA